MDVTVSGRKMPVSDSLKAYAEDKIGGTVEQLDVDAIACEIVLYRDAELDLDKLMEELSDEGEIVRRKQITYTPCTEDEALVKMDLLGHDFFIYTDRDSGEVHVLYRRSDGGYGLLTPHPEA